LGQGDKGDKGDRGDRGDKGTREIKISMLIPQDKIDIVQLINNLPLFSSWWEFDTLSKVGN